MNLGGHLESDEKVSFNQLVNAIYGHAAGGGDRTKLLNAGLPVHKHKVDISSFLVVDLDEFWEWAEKNKHVLDFSKFPKHDLGKEPEWVDKKRKIDFDFRRKARSGNNSPWTKVQDEQLKYMINKGIYTYTEIAKELRKTEGAVKRRLYDLNITARPPKSKSRKWTNEETFELIELVDVGYSWMHIGEKLNRSAFSCRGKYERLLNPTISL